MRLNKIRLYIVGAGWIILSFIQPDKFSHDFITAGLIMIGIAFCVEKQ